MTFLSQIPTSQSQDMSNYLLLEALSQNMEVTVGLPKNQWDQSYSDDEVFHFIPIETDLKRALTYYINANYDVTIAFAPVDFGLLSVEANEVIPFFSWNNVPTIVRVHSGVKNEDAFINFVLADTERSVPLMPLLLTPLIFVLFLIRLTSKGSSPAIFDTQEVFQKPDRYQICI